MNESTKGTWKDLDSNGVETRKGVGRSPTTANGYGVAKTRSSREASRPGAQGRAQRAFIACALRSPIAKHSGWLVAAADARKAYRSQDSRQRRAEEPLALSRLFPGSRSVLSVGWVKRVFR